MPIIGDTLRDLVPFVQFKKGENTHEEVLLLKINTPNKGVFHVFKIVQMVPNRAKHVTRNNCSQQLSSASLLLRTAFVKLTRFSDESQA